MSRDAPGSRVWRLYSRRSGLAGSSNGSVGESGWGDQDAESRLAGAGRLPQGSAGGRELLDVAASTSSQQGVGRRNRTNDDSGRDERRGQLQPTARNERQGQHEPHPGEGERERASVHASPSFRVPGDQPAAVDTLPLSASWLPVRSEGVVVIPPTYRAMSLGREDSRIQRRSDPPHRCAADAPFLPLRTGRPHVRTTTALTRGEVRG